MHRVVASVGAVGALLLASACSGTIEAASSGTGGGRAGTTASTVASSGTGGESGSVSTTGVGGAGTTVASSVASTGAGGAGTTVASSVASTGAGGAATTVASSASSTGAGGAGTPAASSASSTGAGGGGVGPCPPSLLMGLQWTGMDWQTVSVDPTTGQVTALGVVASAQGGFDDGYSAYDPLTRRLFEFGDPYVYAFDPLTGLEIADAVIDVTISNPVVADNGEIVVMVSEGAGAWETATVEPIAGTVTDLAPVAASTSLGQAQCAVDRAANRIYQLGDHLILTLDGASGETLAAVDVAESLFNPVVTAAGRVVGLLSAGAGAWQTATVDPTDGAFTALASFSLAGGVTQGMQTYDPCTDHIYQLGGASLITIDGTTGALISTVTLSSVVMNVQAIF